MRISFLNPRWIAAMALLSAMAPATSFADFSIPNLALSDFDTLVNEFSANSQYTSVTPASSLGGLGGFEIGAIGGITKAPDTLALVKRNDPSTSFKDMLPHAGVLLRVGLPYGLTAEAQYLPKVKAQNLSTSRWAIAAQWTLTDNLLENLPVNIAAKGYYTRTTLNYSQTVSGVPTSVDFKNSLWGVQALVSYKILVFEPYAGIGYTSANGTLGVSAAVPVALIAFLPGGSSQSATSKPTSVQFLAGTDISLAFFSLGAEYERAFGKNSYTGRVSFRF